MSLPPELENYLRNAYNAKQGDFLSRPVFDLTFNENNDIDWAGTNYKLPDQVAASMTTRYIQQNSTLMMKTESDYDRAFSASVSASGSGVSFSGSAESSLLFHGSLFQSNSSTYTLNFYVQKVMDFARIYEKDLNSEFKTTITQLPTSVSAAADKAKYVEFFDNYGTHYVTKGSMGGIIIMQSTIQDTVFEQSSTTEVEAAVSAGYDGVVSKGEISVESAYSSSSFLSSHRSSIRVTLDVLGGKYTGGTESISSWVDTIYNTPSLLLSVPMIPTPLSDLASIADLADVAGASSKIKQNILAMAEEYLKKDSAIITSPTEIDLFKVTKESVGAILLATLSEEKNGDRCFAKGFSDASLNPTTQRVLASQHLWTNADTWVPYASFCMPVGVGQSYYAEGSTTSGNPTTTMKYIGIGEYGFPGIGSSWTSVPLGREETATNDCLVVGYVDWNNANGSRGYIQGLQNNKLICSSSQHYWTGSDVIVPCNSFCMPVKKGTPFKVASFKTSTNPKFAAYRIDLGSSFTFSSYEQRQAGLVYQAKDAPGFLVAHLRQTRNGDRGYVHLYANNSTEGLTSIGKMTSTSIHYYQGNDTWVPSNSATIPVPKGMYYKVDLTVTSGSPACDVWWFNMVPSA